MRESERVELEATRELFVVAPSGVEARTATAGAALAIRVPSIPIRELNRILGLTDLTQLDALEPFYEGGRVVVSLDPETALDDALRARGYEDDYPWQKFERGVEPYDAPTDLRITDAERPEDFGSVFAQGYGLPDEMADWISRVVGLPGWHTFVAYDAAVPVATGALYASRATGWLGTAATLPTHRGRGAQNGVLAARIARAAELGLELLVTETGAPRESGPGPSYRNILRAGFEPVYVRPNYVREAATSAR